MGHLFRVFLVVLLVQLQFFAPLLHAHVDDHFVSVGVHIPGLELLSVNQDTPLLKAANCALSTNDLVVSINPGIKAKLKLSSPVVAYVDHADTVGLLDQQLLVAEVNFSPHVNPLVPSIALQSYSSRAPPIAQV